MKKIDLDSLPYKYRFSGASLLISKANRLWGMSPPESYRATDAQKLIAALAYYDMALTLMKPFDPNYSTVINWKCNVLLALHQYEDAVVWYQEIIRISDQTDGKASRNATASHAVEMSQKYTSRKNDPLKVKITKDATFDDPPYCMVVEEFCLLLSEGNFKKAHLYLGPPLKETLTVSKLKAAWQQMAGKTRSADINLELQKHMVDWPDRKPNDVGWCYFSISTLEFSEAITVVVSRMPNNSDRITQLEFGRP